LRLSASDPIGNSKNKQYDNEDFKKRVHDLVGLGSQPSSKQMMAYDLDLDQTTGGFPGSLEQKERDRRYYSTFRNRGSAAGLKVI
jgi:hypothetical protein